MVLKIVEDSDRPARESVPRCPTIIVSVATRTGSMRRAPRVGRANLKMSLSMVLISSCVVISVSIPRVDRNGYVPRYKGRGGGSSCGDFCVEVYSYAGANVLETTKTSRKKNEM